MADVLVVGSLAFDSISTPLGKVEKALGGSANYFALSASHTSNVRVVGVVGDDYGHENVELLQSRGIDTEGLLEVPGKTFHWEGSYEGDMNEAITHATHLNVFETFDPKLPENYKSSEVLFLANIDPDIQLKVLEQMTEPKIVALDTMNFWIESKMGSLKNVLSKVNIFLLNEGEATMLTGEQNAVGAAEKLCEYGPEIVVIKRGEYGCIMYSKGKYFAIPAFPVKTVIDPTGAGDTFAGGFISYLAKEGAAMDWKHLKMACFYGGLMASFTVQGFGTTKISEVTEKEIQDRHLEYKSVVVPFDYNSL